MLKKLIFTLGLTLLFIFKFESPSLANIYQVTCKQGKTAMVIVYSKKRRQAIMIGFNGAKERTKFLMKKNTPPNTFEAEGNHQKYKTTLNYNGMKNTLAYTQAALRGTNYFLNCQKPILKKQE